MSIELKPCPFCGGSASLYRREYQVPVIVYYDEEWVIECDSQCDLEMREYAQSDVVAAWNTRHNEMGDSERRLDSALRHILEYTLPYQAKRVLPPITLLAEIGDICRAALRGPTD